MQKVGVNFRKMLSAAEQGLIVTPRLQSILYEPSFSTFQVTVPGMDRRREPDGWFHPSTHPLWSERQLFYYLTEPDSLVMEPFEYEGALAVTVGSTVHDGVQHICLEHGLVQRFPNCPCGGGHPEAEEYLADPETGSRGHSDGVWLETGEGLEIKTAHPAIVSGLNKAERMDERVEAFRERKPAYYAQAQDYLRMSGRGRMLVVFISTSYPYELCEVHVPYDRVFANRLREKYLRVREMAKDGRVPHDCCGGEMTCPVRTVCSAVV